MWPQLSRLRHPPTARRGARGSPIGARTPRLPPVPPLFGRPPGRGRRLPRPAAGSAVLMRAASARASGAPPLPSRARPCWACSVRLQEPGSRAARIVSPDFRGCRGNTREGRLGDSQRLVPRPAAAARTARFGPIRGRRRGFGRHALPLGLLRVISRNSVQREEREKERGAEAKGERESVPDRKERPRVSEARER